MKKTNTKITRFETECFYIDIVETESEFEAWLQEKHYGEATVMYGVPKHQKIGGENIDTDFELFCAMIEPDLDDYIYEYYRKYANGWED